MSVQNSILQNNRDSVGIVQDKLGRSPRYLRISITDRCNLGCCYCIGKGERKYIPHEQILRYEEIMRLVRAARNLGIRKVRITGGEPLVRKGCIGFIESLAREFPDLRLAITTNGLALAPYIDQLAKIGLESVNLSLDTLDKAIYAQITGFDGLGQVLTNLHAMLDAGIKVKINAVAIKGISDKYLLDYLDLAYNLPVQMRFIEFMPMGSQTLWENSLFIAAKDLIGLAARHVQLEEEKGCQDILSGPARVYKIPGGEGSLGFISAVSNHFCDSCNRLRITSDGKLRLCLFSDKAVDLARAIRIEKAEDIELENIMRTAWQEKPLGADILKYKKLNEVATTKMVSIGG